VHNTKLRLQIGIFALISLLGVAFVGVKYLHWFDSSYSVFLDAPKTGGAYTHAAVAYRGVPVGRVGEIKVHGDGARLQLLIEDGVDVPRDVKAVVAQRSAVGEQYVDLRPDSASGPFLAEGDTISDVSLPLPMETLLSDLDGLLESIDPDDLAVVVDELGKAFEGNEDSLDRLLDAAQTLIDDAAEHLPQTVDLLRDSETVLQTQIDSADAIRTWADKLAKLTDTVVESDEDIRELIDVAPPAADEVSALVNDLDPSLGVLLGNMISVNGVAVRRLPNLETVLVTYPMVVSGGFTVTPGDGTAHFGLVLNFDNPPPCVYDSGAGEYACTGQEKGGGSEVRGWQNAPGPTGPEIEPVPLPDNGQPKDGGSDAGSHDDEAASSDYGYDPLTGLLVDRDGKPIQFGTTGGQYELAGDQSWKQLLLSGVTS
jgi:phospholipid/cholesterol/gamma-HCH transport system substrate-binding protein